MLAIDYALLGSVAKRMPIIALPDSPFTVESAGLTPVQARADELLRLNLEYFAGNPEQRRSGCYADLRALLDELDPPKPPTLEDAIAVIRDLANGHSIDGEAAAREFLKRVPN